MSETASLLVIRENNCRMEIYRDPYNKRVRVDDYRGNASMVIKKLEKIGGDPSVEKAIIKVRKEDYIFFLENGYQCEAMIDKYFLGSDAYFFCKYFTKERKRNDHLLEEDKIVESVQSLVKAREYVAPPSEYGIKKMEKSDVGKLASLYREVFQIYPTPLHDPAYIEKTMEEGTIYVGFYHGNSIVSAASAEVNDFYKNAELTDCATLPEHRKHGLMKILLEELEKELMSNEVYCAYSIARALSFGMNAVLHQIGYKYRGRLTNNCYIFDKLEDMNVWVKDLSCGE